MIFLWELREHRVGGEGQNRGRAQPGRGHGREGSRGGHGEVEKEREKEKSRGQTNFGNNWKWKEALNLDMGEKVCTLMAYVPKKVINAQPKVPTFSNIILTFESVTKQ